MNLEQETLWGYVVPEGMKQVWAKQMEITQALLDVCSRNGLKCWMECGTLLGAVRHKGFIPWDDDIDFVMLRKDYDKLVAIADQEFKHPYFFQTTYSEEGYYCGHAQIRDVTTTSVSMDELDRKYCKGIFIDIFVLDGFLENPILRFLHRTATMIVKKSIRGYLADMSDKMSLSKRAIAILSKGLYRFIDYKKAFQCYENLFRMVDCDKAERVAVISYKYSTHHYIRRRSGYNEQKWMPFEDKMFPAPTDVHDALVCYFGEDYMTPLHLPSDHGRHYMDAQRPYEEVVPELKAHPERFAEKLKTLYTE
jgi:lipopolysaccharide cholinephosphotransferase